MKMSQNSSTSCSSPNPRFILNAKDEDDTFNYDQKKEQMNKKISVPCFNNKFQSFSVTMIDNKLTPSKQEEYIDACSDNESIIDNEYVVIGITTLPRSKGDHTIVHLARGLTYTISTSKNDPDVYLRNTDLLRLKSSNFINESVIDLFMTLKCETRGWNNVSFLKCHLTRFILGYNSSKISNLPPGHLIFNCLNRSPKDFLFLPYTLEKHWALVVLNIREATFHHYDPLNKHSLNKIKNKFDIFLKLCQKMKILGPFKIATETWNTAECDNYPK